MTYRSSASFAFGGVAWLDQNDQPGDATAAPPGGWRCFHCNEHFTHWRAAHRHFGAPGSAKTPECTTDDRAGIVAWLRDQSEKGAEVGITMEKGSYGRGAYGGGSLVLKRAADMIENGEYRDSMRFARTLLSNMRARS